MKRSINSSIEQRATELLRRADIHRAPVPIEQVARFLGLSISGAELGEDVSGVLVVRDGTGLIGFNRSQAPVRQRFSIAHEIGHFVLHHEASKLFIDKAYSSVYFRNEASATGERLQEIQANQFAAALLMPADLLHREVAERVDVGDDESLSALAAQFQVSLQALSLRLAHLGLIDPDHD